MRHPLHALCPYFAMFPESFVSKHLIWTKPGDLVLDPFCGRGTTVLEALLAGRRVAACDTNPVAVCVAWAKADIPDLGESLERIHELEGRYSPNSSDDDPELAMPFFNHCYHPSTLRQVLFLRRSLSWRNDRVDRFLAACTLSALHGESHRTRLCLSNRMPRTISTKPDYSVRWWLARGATAPERDTFAVLRDVVALRLAGPRPPLVGQVLQVDARKVSTALGDLRGQVSLLITSPPYLDTTNYAEDQWLRLWFVGGPPYPDRGLARDDRHRNGASYWQFLREAWTGASDLLGAGAHIVIRIGGRDLGIDEVQDRLSRSLEGGLRSAVTLRSRIASEIKGSQVRAFRPGTQSGKVEFDFHFQMA